MKPKLVWIVERREVVKQLCGQYHVDYTVMGLGSSFDNAFKVLMAEIEASKKWHRDANRVDNPHWWAIYTEVMNCLDYDQHNTVVENRDKPNNLYIYDQEGNELDYQPEFEHTVLLKEKELQKQRELQNQLGDGVCQLNFSF